MSAIPNNLDYLGPRLVMARRAAGKTQEQVAENLGMSRPTYIAIEKGTRRPPPSEVLQIAQFLGCQVSDLLRSGNPVTFQPHKREMMAQMRGEDLELDSALADMERFADEYVRLEHLLGRPLRSNLPPIEQLPTRGGVAEMLAFAEDLASRERSRLRFGEQPVLRLREVLENEVGFRIYYGPMPSRTSGMYAYSPEVGCIVMVNSKHPASRRRMTLAHEYGHMLTEDRNRPGVDYVHSIRKPAGERFVEAFAMSFLIPLGAVRRAFHDVINRTGDFQVADLVRAASFFAVSVQAMTLRLEGIGLVPSGTWESLKTSGLNPGEARQQIGEPSIEEEGASGLPERFRLLAVHAFQQGLIGESELARLLRVDRIEAREIVSETQAIVELTDVGIAGHLKLPFDRSLVT